MMDFELAPPRHWLQFGVGRGDWVPVSFFPVPLGLTQVRLWVRCIRSSSPQAFAALDYKPHRSPSGTSYLDSFLFHTIQPEFIPHLQLYLSSNNHHIARPSLFSFIQQSPALRRTQYLQDAILLWRICQRSRKPKVQLRQPNRLEGLYIRKHGPAKDRVHHGQ